MPTLLQINSCANIGSTGRIVEQIGSLAMSQGWNSLIVHGETSYKSESQLIRVGSNINLYAHWIETKLFDNHGLSSRMPTRRLISRLKELSPDIIHLHNIHGYYLNYRLLFEYLNSTCTPVVWTLHDCWAFTGHCGHFLMADCTRWKEGCGNCPITRTEYPKSLIDRSERNYKLKRKYFVANDNLHIVTVSEWLAGVVHQSFLKDKDIKVINNGVDLNIFKPLSIANGAKEHIILGVSNVWTKEKGLNDFFLLRELLDPKLYSIKLVGLRKEQIEKLPEGIEGIERTSSARELASYYSAASVFVNLTYADTFPTVNIESLACGTPVVTYRTGGSPESIDENTGIVVDRGNLNEVAISVQEICHKGRDYYSKACRERAVNKYNKDDKYEDYIALYNSLL